jgi:hypothetical protein
MRGALGVPWRTCQTDKSRPEPHAQPVAYMRQRSGRDHCGCTTPAPRSDGGQPCGRTWEEKRHQRSVVARSVHPLSSSRLLRAQGSSWFPLHICGVKPTVSKELPFNQQVCGVEAKHTMYTCETPREYYRTSVVPTQSAGIRTGVNELMSRAAGPPPLPPSDTLTRLGVGPSSLDGLDGGGAYGASRPRYDSGPHDTAMGAQGALAVPGSGPHTP